MQLPMDQAPAGERRWLETHSGCCLDACCYTPSPLTSWKVTELHRAAPCQWPAQQNHGAAGETRSQRALPQHQHLTRAHPATLADSTAVPLCWCQRRSVPRDRPPTAGAVVLVPTGRRPW